MKDIRKEAQWTEATRAGGKGKKTDLFLLAHSDGIVLVRLLALGESITAKTQYINFLAPLLKCGHSRFPYPWPPAALGAPVSPPAMTLEVVVNERAVG